jgi:RNA polymerase sigma-70 factor (ECF subfamily)
VARKSDPELVDAVRRGGTTEFAELYRVHAGAVKAIAASLVRDDPETVADLVQDTFLRALYSLSSLQDASRLGAWLAAIARNLATDHLRRRRRVTVLDASGALDLADTSPGPANLAELSELAKRVEGCVTGLSRRDATAIALVTHFGFGSGQVAAALGLTQGAAEVLLHRARRRLRQALVLQVMARQPQLACPELGRILSQEPAAAARHVARCDECISAAASEVFAGGERRSRRVPLRLDQATALPSGPSLLARD